MEPSAAAGRNALLGAEGGAASLASCVEKKEVLSPKSGYLLGVREG